MTALDLPMVFSFGLLGSLHCVQMCGPIVLAYSLPLAGGATGGRRSNLLLSHIAYNAGRITTYTALGAAAGAAGHALGMIGRLAGIENAVSIVAGAFLILTGLSFAGLLPVSGILRAGPANMFSRVHRAAGRLLTAPSRRSKFGLGLALGFLPCGFLYAGLLKAVETGNPLAGAASMLCFGLGTAAAMIGTGLFSSALAAPLRRWGNRVAAAGVILLGVLLLYRGLMGRGMPSPLDQGGDRSIHGHH